jgi:hypothetical protein
MNRLLRLAPMVVISAFMILAFTPCAHSAESLSNRALNLMRKGQPDQAVKLLSAPKAMKDAGLSSIQGWAYLRLNEPDAAETAFRRSIGLKAKQSDAHCGLGYVPTPSWNSRRRDNIVQSWVGIWPDEHGLSCGLAMALEQTGD